jgi:hypothetical protein
VCFVLGSFIPQASVPAERENDADQWHPIGSIAISVP